MAKRKIIKKIPVRNRLFSEFCDESEEWLKLTPAQRLKEAAKLWELYISLGGKLDPEPDPQSPFYFPKT